MFRQGDGVLKAAEERASQAAAKRRKQILVLFFSAMGAIALGMVLIYAMQGSRPPDVPQPPPNQQTNERQPPVVATQTTPIPVPQTKPTEVVKDPVPQVVAPQTQVTPPPQIVVKQYPAMVQMASVLMGPIPGGGVSDYVQSLNFSISDVESPDRIRSLTLRFGNDKSDYAGKDNRLKLSAANRGESEIFLTAADSVNRKNDEVVRLIFELQRRGGLEVKWKTPVMLRDPEMTSLAYWLLQSSTVELVGAATKEQRLAFRPWESAAIKLSETSSDLNLPIALPKDAVAAVPTNLPDGWKGNWYIDWDSKEATLRKPENASQVIKFAKPTSSGAVESWFLLTFKPDFTKVESTLAKRMAADAADLASAEADLRAITNNIAGFRRDGANALDLQPYLDKQNAITKLVTAYKEALAGYKELTTFVVPIEMPDGMHLTNLHFVQDK